MINVPQSTDRTILGMFFLL